jgi:hypothetical protein
MLQRQNGEGEVFYIATCLQKSHRKLRLLKLGKQVTDYFPCWRFSMMRKRKGLTVIESRALAIIVS